MRSKFPEFFPVSKERIEVVFPFVLNRVYRLTSFSKMLWKSLNSRSNVPITGDWYFQNRENDYEDRIRPSVLFSEKIDVVIFSQSYFYFLKGENAVKSVKPVQT